MTHSGSDGGALSAASVASGSSALAPWPARRLRTDLALVFGLTALLGYAAIVVARLPGTISVVCLANSVAMALIVSAPRERTLALLAVAAAGNLSANLAYGDPLNLALAFVPPNLGEVALGVWLMRRTGLAGRYAEDQWIFMRVMLAGAVLPPLLGATFGAATLQWLGFAEFSRVWADWYLGDTIGAVAMLPLGLALRAGDARVALRRLAAPFNLMMLAIVILGTAAALHWVPHPFVVVSMLLISVAFVRLRIEAFAAVAMAVSALALLLALGVRAAPDSPEDRVLFFFSALLAAWPAQLVAVTVARQRALSQTLAAVGSRVDDIVTLTTLDGTLRWVNQAREIYWGVPNEQVIGRVPDVTLPSEFRETVFKPMFAQAIQGQVVRRRIDVDYPGRGPRTMDMSMQPARDEEGLMIGVLYCASDITELENSRRELERTAQALRVSRDSLEQFVRIASHDLREPLNTIAQFCGLIEEQKAAQLDAAGKLYFAHVRGGAIRMKQMLDDVMAFVRLDEQTSRPPAHVDLDALLLEVRQDLHALIDSKAARIEASSLGAVVGHRVLLALLLQNLLTNALKFVPPDRTPQVQVSALRDGVSFRLLVHDNGIGIAAERIAELGTPFRRLHARRRFEGTGLGLAICTRIAEQHGGTIEIRSTPGEGSCVALVMPAEIEADSSLDHPLAAGLGLSPARDL